MQLLWEFLRYVLVGGISFLADWGTLYLFCEHIFHANSGWPLYIATALGFVVGVIVNYILSNVFVFVSADQKGKGKSVKAFIIFVIVGLIGLGLTELGMWLLVDVAPYEAWLNSWGHSAWSEYYYLCAKIVVAAVVLVWNYVARKKLIYSDRGKTH